MKTEQLTHKNISLNINYKKIKSIIIKIKGIGKIEVSAPLKTPEEKILSFVDSKISWIRKNESKVHEEVEKLKVKNFHEDEYHYFLGDKFKIKIIDSKNYQVKIEENFLILEIPIATSIGARKRLLETWYMENLKRIVENSFEKWEKKTGLVKSNLVYEKMRGKWGYCNHRTKLISINTEIIKKDLEFIDYVVLHEICHLKIPNHGTDFKKLLNTYLPNWKRISKID
jgi:hypothetical protein